MSKQLQNLVSNDHRFNGYSFDEDGAQLFLRPGYIVPTTGSDTIHEATVEDALRSAKTIVPEAC